MNNLKILDNRTLENDLLPIKVGDDVTPIEISKDGVNISGTLKVNDTAVQTGSDANTITALNNATVNELVTVGAQQLNLMQKQILFLMVLYLLLLEHKQ